MRLGYIVLLLSISSLYSETMVRIIANWVNVMDNPSYQGQVIGQARQDETYIFQGRQGEWYKIVLPDQRTGWIIEVAGQIETGVAQPSQTQPSISRKPSPYTPARGGIYTISELWEKFSPAVVVIYTYDSNGDPIGQGTGFFISNYGEIITSRHVLQGAYTAQVKTTSGETFSVKSILAEDKEADLVKISITTPKRGFLVVNLAKKDPEVGEQVVVIGNPKGLKGSVSEGIISGIREIPGFGKIIQTTASISPGSSGSPVFNLNGEVVGVIVSSLIEGQNLNFAIPVSRIRTLKPCREISLSDWALGDIETWLKTPDGLYWTGFMFLQNEDYITAIKYFKKVIELDPTYPDAYFQVGYCYYKLGQYYKAIQPFRQAIRIEPDYADAYYNLGLAYAKLGWYQEAIKAYKQAIYIKPDYALAYYNLGLAYGKLGWYQEAINEYRILLNLDRKLANKLYNLIYQ